MKQKSRLSEWDGVGVGAMQSKCVRLHRDKSKEMSGLEEGRGQMRAPKAVRRKLKAKGEWRGENNNINTREHQHHSEE